MANDLVPSGVHRSTSKTSTDKTGPLLDFLKRSFPSLERSLAVIAKREAKSEFNDGRKHLMDNNRRNESYDVRNGGRNDVALKRARDQYLKELKELQKEAYETWGSRYKSKDEYKKELALLNKESYDKLKEAQQEDRENRQTFFNKVSKKLDNLPEKESLKGLLGPLNLIMSPLQDFFGSGAFKKFVGGIKTKFTKRHPSESDVLKIGTFSIGTGFVFLANKLGEFFGDKAEKAKGFLDGIDLGALGGTIGKTLSGGALAAGVALKVYDAVQGFYMSDEWGVSKLSGAIGGFLGGKGSGWGNAFKNAGEWALIGAGAGGLVGGPVGALVGGLAGAVFGGVLGYFGGEKIAQWCNDIIDSFNVSTLTDNIKRVWEDSQLSFFGKVGMSFTEMFEWFQNGSGNAKLSNINRSTTISQQEKDAYNYVASQLGTDTFNTMFDRQGRYLADANLSLIRGVADGILDSDKIAPLYRNADVLAGTYKTLKNIFGKDSYYGLAVDGFFSIEDWGEVKYLIEKILGLHHLGSAATTPSEYLGSNYGTLQSFLNLFRDVQTPNRSVTWSKFEKDHKKGKNGIYMDDGFLKANNTSQVLLRGDGTSVRFNPNDNIYASTNNIVGNSKKFAKGSLFSGEGIGSVSAMIAHSLSKLETVVDSNGEISVGLNGEGINNIVSKLENVITLLGSINKKELVVETPTSRSDLLSFMGSRN